MKRFLISILILALAGTATMAAPVYWFIQVDSTQSMATAHLRGAYTCGKSTSPLDYSVYISSGGVLLSKSTIWFDLDKTWGVTEQNGVLKFTNNSGGLWSELGGVGPGTTYYNTIQIDSITATGSIMLMPNGKTSGLKTTYSSGSLYLDSIGTTMIYLRSIDAGSNSVNLYMTDQAASNYLQLSESATSADILSGTFIDIKPNGDANDYYRFETTANVPKIVCEGATYTGTLQYNDVTDAWEISNNGTDFYAILTSTFQGGGGSPSSTNYFRFTIPGQVVASDTQQPDNWQVFIGTGVVDYVVAVVSGTSDGWIRVDLETSTDFTTWNSIFTSSTSVCEIDAGENSSVTGANPYVIDGTYDNITLGSVMRCKVESSSGTLKGRHLSVIGRIR